MRFSHLRLGGSLKVIVAVDNCIKFDDSWEIVIEKGLCIYPYLLVHVNMSEHMPCLAIGAIGKRETGTITSSHQHN